MSEDAIERQLKKRLFFENSEYWPFFQKINDLAKECAELRKLIRAMWQFYPVLLPKDLEDKAKAAINGEEVRDGR